MKTMSSVTYRRLVKADCADVDMSSNQSVLKFADENTTEILYNYFLASTSDGRVGLAPIKVQPGDLIVILFGGKAPFIVRKTGANIAEDVIECRLIGHG